MHTTKYAFMPLVGMWFVWLIVVIVCMIVENTLCLEFEENMLTHKHVARCDEQLPIASWPISNLCESLSGGVCMDVNSTALSSPDFAHWQFGNETVNACVCRDGWSRRGDFYAFHMNYMQCTTHEVVSLVLWVVECCANLFICIAAMRRYSDTQECSTRQDRCYYILAAVAHMFLVAVGVMHVLFGKNIANDKLTSLLFSCGSSCFWVATGMVVLTFVSDVHNLSTLVGTSSRFSVKRVGVTRVVERIAVAFSVLNIGVSFLPTASTFVEPCQVNLQAAIYYHVCALSCFTGSYIVFIVFRMMENDFRRHVSCEEEGETKVRLRNAILKVRRLRRDIAVTAWLNTLLCISMATVPMLRHLTAYEVPFAWATSSLITWKFLYLRNRTANSSKRYTSASAKVMAARALPLKEESFTRVDDASESVW